MKETWEPRVKVSKHAIIRYKERILKNIEANDFEIIDLIRRIFREAHYVSDNGNGILFRNEELMMEMIVKNGVVTTVYFIDKKKKRRKNAVNSKNSR